MKIRKSKSGEEFELTHPVSGQALKPIIQLYIPEQSLSMIMRGHYPSRWWRQCPSDEPMAIAINVTSDWFLRMREYERKLESTDLPF